MRPLRWANTLVLAALGAAGMLKFADLGAFIRALNSWTLLPKWAIPGVAAFVPMLEGAILVVWLGARQRHAAVWLAAALLAIFCSALGAQALFGPLPACHCFGALSSYLRTQSDARVHCGLTATLAALLTIEATLSRRIGGALASG